MNNMANYTVSEEYVLPSQGKIYDVPVDPRIKLRPMTVAEEMKRQSRGNSINWNLCQIIQDCLITPLPIPVYDLAVPDYEYLVHKLRVVTYGADYKMTVGCPHCREKGVPHIHQYTANLDELKVIRLDDDEILNKFASCQKFILPICKQEIKLRIPTPRIEDEIQNMLKEYAEKNPESKTDMSILFTLQALIDTIDGIKPGYIQLQEFIKRMHAADYNVLSQKLNKLNSFFGINKLLSVKCPTCGGAFQSMFRVTSEFYGPTID